MLKFGLVLVLLVCTVTALFEREVGKNDWTKEFIGHVKHAKFGCDKKDVFVGTDNVIANINIRTGKITWRRVLEVVLNRTTDRFRRVKQYAVLNMKSVHY
jgi:ribosomal protein L4